MADLAVTVAIASCGRETLVRTLASLDALDVPSGVRVDILVADDDPDRGASRRIAAARPAGRRVRCIAVGARNISRARNACLREARGELIAFIDDDEWAAPNWLARMLACKREFGATCVFGPVYPQYPDGTPDWMVRADPLHVDWGARGRIVTTGRSGNALFDRDFIARNALQFDPALGASGGEDTAFFAAVHRAGGRLVVTDDAPVYEHVPSARLALAYIRTRSLRGGQSYARIALDEKQGLAARSLFALDAFAKMLAAGTAAAAAFPADRAISLRMAVKAWANRGKLREIAGRPLPLQYRPGA